MKVSGAESFPGLTPRATGFRQPAEWEAHEACWVAWPSHPELWGHDLAAVREQFVTFCRLIADPDPSSGAARGEGLVVLVRDDPGELAARDALAGLPCRFRQLAFGDIWLRDTAPIFLTRGDGAVAVARFAFNGWGGKYR